MLSLAQIFLILCLCLIIVQKVLCQRDRDLSEAGGSEECSFSSNLVVEKSLLIDMALWTPLKCLSLLHNGETSSGWKLSSFLVMQYVLAGWDGVMGAHLVQSS